MDDKHEEHISLIPKDLENILAWNPPRLELRPPPSRWMSSTPTLPPRVFYTKHIDDKLVLKQVFPLESLTQDLARFASVTLSSAFSDCPTNILLSNHAFGSTLGKATRIPNVMYAPEALADYRSESIGEFCCTLATKALIPNLAAFESSVCFGRHARPPMTSRTTWMITLVSGF
ncbi:hypothetical protein MIND_00303500 [Mycena indigotica]|uniref:Uncharacterized protein n=1 Tax=Mycena indigotica TaxID=2126181 RepID=A0A8H6T1W1_9AGAR|nr:uncharacterized protein MIND_00303500 [Mycena indigotica]KAF7309330.1 hypothetical protein MIND_00303500 [Mycena indigotica]